ncbi:MAG: hypothetical protein K6L81_16150 [Agarilytica sp.]
MKYVILSPIVLSLGLSMGSAHGAEFSLEEGKDNSLCKTVLENVIKKDEEGNRYYKLKQVIPSDTEIKWNRSFYYLKNTAETTYKPKQKIKISRVDIDNDGNLETLVLDSYMLRSQLGELLYIMEKGSEYSDILSKGTILNEDRWSYKGLKSAPDWPYGDLGIYIPQIHIFSIKGKNLIAVKDLYFGSNRTERAFSGRTLILAEYSGGEIPFREKKNSTIELNVFCRISSKEEISNKMLNQTPKNGAG